MIKQKILKILVPCIFLSTTITPVFAANIQDKIETGEYSKEFKDYLQLSEEERSKILQPSPIEIINTKTKIKNPLKRYSLIGSSLQSKFSLKDENVLGSKLKIKDQKSTNTCWAFAALESLETNLLLKDKTKTYDFSEKHMNYATSRNFLNNQVNTMGFNREVSEGGNWEMALAYLTNGLGAINESQMPFTDDNNKIQLSEIQNKTVTSQVFDTRAFPSHESNDADIEEFKTTMKDYIKKYGSIAAKIYGAKFQTDYYNNSTGAIYCDDKEQCKTDHGVSIIGWDDDFPVSSFNEKHKPKNKGAWIVKNTWGEKLEYSLSEMKETIFNALEQQCKEKGWESASQIPDDKAKEMFESLGFEISGDKGYIPVGDKGYMYISYEDVNIYSSLIGIMKAADSTNYENIYQYDIYGANGTINIKQEKDAYLGTVFNKKTTGKEYLTQVSLYAPETYTCQVYVNPNSSSKAKDDLQLVQLKEGETETFDAGYHTLEFENPIEIKSNSFAVVIKVNGAEENEIKLSTEGKVENTSYSVVDVESEKCFITYGQYFDRNEWIDTSKMSQQVSGARDVDTTIKAFTTSKLSGGTDPGTDPGTNPGTNPGTDPGTNPGTNTGGDPGTTPTPQTKPQPSNFNSAKPDVKKVAGYAYIDLNKEEYVTIDMEINGITRNVDSNNKYEYYYYLSGNQSESNITGWTKIKETQSSNNKLTFKIDTREISNYEELYDAEELYVYVKEVVSNSVGDVETISKGMLLDIENDEYEMEFYIDDENIESYSSNFENWYSGYDYDYDDDTTASFSIPKAGIVTIIGLLVIVSVAGVIIFIRYKMLSKYIK